MPTSSFGIKRPGMGAPAPQGQAPCGQPQGGYQPPQQSYGGEYGGYQPPQRSYSDGYGRVYPQPQQNYGGEYGNRYRDYGYGPRPFDMQRRAMLQQAEAQLQNRIQPQSAAFGYNVSDYQRQQMAAQQAAYRQQQNPYFGQYGGVY